MSNETPDIPSMEQQLEGLITQWEQFASAGIHAAAVEQEHNFRPLVELGAFCHWNHARNLRNVLGKWPDESRELDQEMFRLSAEMSDQMEHEMFSEQLARLIEYVCEAKPDSEESATDHDLKGFEDKPGRQLA